MDSLFPQLLEARGACALLESTTAASPLARRTLLARDPRAILIADGRGSRITTFSGTRAAGGDALDLLRQMSEDLPRGEWPEEGALVGAIAYDYVRPRGARGRPLLVAMAVDRLSVVEDGRTIATGARGRAGLDAALTAGGDDATAAETRSPIDLARHSNLSRDEYRRQVRRLQEHIAAGDIYQANLSQRFAL